MIPATPIMTDIIVKIMIELLSVLALATKQIEQGRFSKYAIIHTLPVAEYSVPQRSSRTSCWERAR